MVGKHEKSYYANYATCILGVSFSVGFLSERREQILSASWQHLSLVVQCLILATVIAIGIAALCYRNRALTSLANNVSAIGLTIPSFALIGLLIVPLGFGVMPAVVVITFYAVLPILRNAIVGFSGVDGNVLEAARGIGMSRTATFVKVELPLAWPVILAGMRISAQMVMGIAAISAYALGPGPGGRHGARDDELIVLQLGPGLGGFIFTGLTRLGGANSLESVLTGVIAVVVLALILDGLLLLVGRLTTSRGIHV